ncbi:MAG TPA: HIT domain-containing protein [Thermoplasmata archaeon]|nr:HIT domain-containing protein [Thermoplasmata archaeon]
MREAASCIFCQVVRRDAPASIVCEDEWTVAFLDILPINPGHALVVPKAHSAMLADLSSEEGGRIFQAGMRVAAALRTSGVRCEGVNFHLADGEVAGQEVFHVHLHVYPRFSGDGVGLRMGPRYGAMPSRTELDGLAAKLREIVERSGAR